MSCSKIRQTCSGTEIFMPNVQQFHRLRLIFRAVFPRFSSSIFHALSKIPALTFHFPNESKDVVWKKSASCLSSLQYRCAIKTVRKRMILGLNLRWIIQLGSKKFLQSAKRKTMFGEKFRRKLFSCLSQARNWKLQIPSHLLALKHFKATRKKAKTFN